jgi:hypothetical protein
MFSPIRPSDFDKVRCPAQGMDLAALSVDLCSVLKPLSEFGP